jgi:hypothetical protein
MAGVSPLQIWTALLKAGASVIQAAGIMGNMIAESSLNPEAVQQGVSDPGYGLVQWEASSYPTAPSLVTGNPAADLAAQIQLLTSTGGFQAASGSTVAETAGNFAANYERCDGCESGGSQFSQRITNAEQVAGWASSGSWPATSAQGSTTAVLTSAQISESNAAQADCLWSIGWGGIPGTSWLSDLFGGGGNVGGGEVCIFSKSEARAMAGIFLMVAGVVIMAFGAGGLLGVAALQAPKLIQAAGTPARVISQAAGVPAKYSAAFGGKAAGAGAADTAAAAEAGTAAGGLAETAEIAAV